MGIPDRGEFAPPRGQVPTSGDKPGTTVGHGVVLAGAPWPRLRGSHTRRVQMSQEKLADFREAWISETGLSTSVPKS